MLQHLQAMPLEVVWSLGGERDSYACFSPCLGAVQLGQWPSMCAALWVDAQSCLPNGLNFSLPPKRKSSTSASFGLRAKLTGLMHTMSDRAVVLSPCAGRGPGQAGLLRHLEQPAGGQQQPAIQGGCGGCLPRDSTNPAAAHRSRVAWGHKARELAQAFLRPAGITSAMARLPRRAS